MKPIVLRVLSLLLVSLLFAVCAAPTDRIVQTPEQTSRATRTPASAGTARPQPTNTTVASDVLTLIWWTPEFISPKAPALAGPLLAKQLADFEAAHEGKVRVNPVLKARYGKGGLLDFLRTTQPVAPGLLPDIVALDVADSIRLSTWDCFSRWTAPSPARSPPRCTPSPGKRASSTGARWRFRTPPMWSTPSITVTGCRSRPAHGQASWPRRYPISSPPDRRSRPPRLALTEGAPRAVISHIFSWWDG